jgi:hypothetical protein
VQRNLEDVVMQLQEAEKTDDRKIESANMNEWEKGQATTLRTG